MRILAVLSLTLVLAACARAGADPVPPKVRSAAFVEMVAERGVACGLLRPWQGLSLRALALTDRENWPGERVEKLRDETARLAQKTGCDAEILTVWIDAAQKGFDHEMLPPYLVVYKTLAQMNPPPRVFTATSLRLDRRPVIAAIDAKLAALEASGRPAEGGKSWPEYIADTSATALEFSEQLETEGGDQAAGWIAQSARIIEVWYEDSARLENDQ